MSTMFLVKCCKRKEVPQTETNSNIEISLALLKSASYCTAI